MRFRLRYLKHDLELFPGTFVIGRSAECQLSLDDPLVSRRHALLLVGDDEVYVEDAGSRNGVLVNGGRINGRHRLGEGDRVTIGAQDMTLSMAGDAEQPKKTWMHTSSPQGPVTIVSMPAAAKSNAPYDGPREGSGATPLPSAPVDEPTMERPKRGEALKLLGGVADKALALGNPESAERLLQNGLQEIATDVRAGKDITSDSIDLAARFAARLASGTGKGSWGDYAIQLYAARGVLPPASIVDELYVAARKMRGFDLAAFRSYLGDQRKRAGDLTPTERFVLQRLDGLERLVASR
ncbi:MAG: FHA domain-containing protein [Polyangiales bacterium]